MANRRSDILEAAIDLLREGGFRDLTQPKVAAKAHITQSHLTYYFPTRSDLLQAVAETVVDRHLARWDAAGMPGTAEALIERMVMITSSAPNSRAVLSLILAADSEPAVHGALIRLVGGLRERTTIALKAYRGEPATCATASAIDARLLHATWVGFSVVALAEGDQADPGANRLAIERLVSLLLPSTAGDAAS